MLYWILMLFRTRPGRWLCVMRLPRRWAPSQQMRWETGCRILLSSSVADPNPDPPDPRIFGPPGSGSGFISQRCGSGSGSGSFYQAKMVRKTLISAVLWILFDLLPSKNYVKVPVPSQSSMQKNVFKKFYFFVGILKVNDENRRIRIC